MFASCSSGDARPLVTLAVFAYNQEKYIRQAILGAFAQTYEPLEIVLSDDCSSDRTYEIIKEQANAYSGPHKIVVNRNERNLNVGGHVRKISELASGYIIIMAAGDDVSLATRTELLVKYFIEHPSAYAVYSDMDHIDDEGFLVSSGKSSENDPKRIARYEIIRNGGGVGTGAAFAYRAVCFYWPWAYPPFYLNEDRLLPLRAVLLGEVYHLPQVLVQYRANTDGAFRNRDPSKVMAKFNEKYMVELARTLVAAEQQHRVSHLASYLLRNFVIRLPKLSNLLLSLEQRGNFLDRLFLRIIMNLLHADTLFERIKLKVVGKFQKLTATVQ